MLTVAVFAAASSAIVVLVALPFLRRWTVDTPNHRSSHITPTPRGGGVAVVAGMAIGVIAGALFETDVTARVWVTLGIVTLAGTLGFADDLRPLSAYVRLLVSLLLSAAVVIVVAELPSTPAQILLALIGAVFVAGYTNTFNFMDGINGISALNTVVTGAWFALLAADHNLHDAQILAISLLAAAAAFAPFNTPRALVFLGDVGSYAIGISIGALAVLLAVEGVPVVAIGAPLMLYVLDTFTTFSKRVLAGRSWSEAHREHTYQRLVDAGHGHLAVALLTVAISLAICATAAASHNRPIPVVTVGLILGATYLLLPKLTIRERRAAND